MKNIGWFFAAKRKETFFALSMTSRKDVLHAFEIDDRECLLKIYSDLLKKIFSNDIVKTEEDLIQLYYGGTLYRNVGAEVYLPSRLKKSVKKIV